MQGTSEPGTMVWIALTDIFSISITMGVLIFIYFTMVIPKMAKYRYFSICPPLQ